MQNWSPHMNFFYFFNQKHIHITGYRTRIIVLYGMLASRLVFNMHSHSLTKATYLTCQEVPAVASLPLFAMMQFADIQGSLEAAPSNRSDNTSEGHPAQGSPLTLSPEASGGLAPQGEASQGSLEKAPGDEQKKRSKREWQQSLRSSNKFKSADATRGPWGLSAHSPKTERRSAQMLCAHMQHVVLPSSASMVELRFTAADQCSVWHCCPCTPTYTMTRQGHMNSASRFQMPWSLSDLASPSLPCF